MSLAELKKQAGALSAQERLELAAYLAELEEQSEAGFHQVADRRMQTIGRGGEGHSRAV